MFTKPSSGWVNIKIEDFEERASYLTDIPNDCLNVFINFFKERKEQIIHFDAEGWEYHLILTYDHVYVILEKYDANEKSDLIQFKITVKELARDFLNDLECNYDEWSKWDYMDETDEPDDFGDRIRLLRELLN